MLYTKKCKYLCLVLLFFYVRSVQAELAVWPQPVNVSTGDNGATWLNENLSLLYICEGEWQFQLKGEQYSMNASDWRLLSQSAKSTDQFATGFTYGQDYLLETDIVQKAVHRTIEHIYKTQFVPWKFHSRNTDFEPHRDEDKPELETLYIEQKYCPQLSPVNPRQLMDQNESYRIDVTAEKIHISSESTLSTLRALETVKQLFYRSELGGIYIPNLPISIVDQPKWSHRGLSLDIARNVIGIREVRHTIDAMATAKFSRLHIHATDSQSWPLEIPSLPDLAQKGAYRMEQIWSAKDLEDVQVYGLERGISVFVEIDSPGHTASIAHAYPELVAAFNELDWSTFAAEPLSGQVKLNSQDVKDFFQKLLGDLLPRISSYTHLYHLGGDEVNVNVHLLDETVRSNSTAVLQPLLQKFMSSMINHALIHGLQPIVWEEMILDWNLTLPKSRNARASTDTLVQVWRDTRRIAEVLEKGCRVIFGDHRHWYLDCGFGVGFLDPYPKGRSPPGIPHNTSGGQPSKLKPPYLDYCNPFHNWRDIFVYNPVEGIKTEHEHLIEGGEVLLWSEQTDSVDLDFKLWPRAAAAAEVLWSGPRNETMLQDAARRLGHWRERAVLDLNIGCSPVHMTWCFMEGGCNL